MELENFDSHHRVSSGKHFYQFYKNKEDFLRVTLPFLRAGLEKGEACLWLISERKNLDEIYESSEEKIPRFRFYLELGQLHIYPAEAWYLTRGMFDQERALSNFSSCVERMETKGFERLRGAGDVAAIPKADWAPFFFYEIKIDEMIKKTSAIALCAYPIQACGLEETKRVLTSHQDVLIRRPY